MKAFIIGAGGVGSFAAPVLCKLIGASNVCVIDGDTLEEKNLDRQLFDETDIGNGKANALALRYGCEALSQWFSFGQRAYDPYDWLICLVDNHPGRLAVLETCDFNRCQAIIAGNETYSSEAYVYLPEWKGTNLDPRVFYPEIATDHSGDPRRASIGCTGEAQVNNRQLVTANFMAAALAMHLFVAWAMEAPKLVKADKTALKHLPHKLTQTLSRSESFKAEIKEKGQTV